MKSLSDRVKISKETADKVSNYMKTSGFSFVKKLAGSDEESEVSRCELALGYLLFEAGMSAEQVAADINLTSDRIWHVKCTLLKYLRPKLNA